MEKDKIDRKKIMGNTYYLLENDYTDDTLVYIEYSKMLGFTESMIHSWFIGQEVDFDSKGEGLYSQYLIDFTYELDIVQDEIEANYFKIAC